MTMISQQGSRYIFDVLVIGSGLAALSFCLKLSEQHPDAKIALVTKTQLSECNSRYAQGGIAACYPASSNKIDLHIKDTLNAGDGLCLESAVEHILQQSPNAIECLLRYGVVFNKTLQDFDLAQEGGHSERRIYHCGDETGASIMQELVPLVLQSPQITVLEHHIAVNLIQHRHEHEPQDHAEVIGCFILNDHTSLIDTYLAKVTVLATGGAGKTFRYTTNSEVATGDGVAMAYRAGARVGNMEFYQFHPTLLFHPTLNHFLISEAIRGEGAYLRSVDNGQRFMERYAPQQMELATRDVVARAIFNEIENSSHNFVYLDITHKSREFLMQRFPKTHGVLNEIGIDMSQDFIPVVPAAHYQCGGILSDVYGNTDLKRLYAIGEVAFTGLHGSNRLASNSLLEAVILGESAAIHCQKDLTREFQVPKILKDWSSNSVVNLRRASQINAHWRGLRGEMTSYAGIVRTEAGLRDLLQLILTRKKIIEEYYWDHTITRDLIELRNIIQNAELIVSSALSRRESRGGHYREDFPHKHQQAQSTCNII